MANCLNVHIFGLAAFAAEVLMHYLNDLSINFAVQN